MPNYLIFFTNIGFFIKKWRDIYIKPIQFDFQYDYY